MTPKEPEPIGSSGSYLSILQSRKKSRGGCAFIAVQQCRATRLARSVITGIHEQLEGPRLWQAGAATAAAAASIHAAPLLTARLARPVYFPPLRQSDVVFDSVNPTYNFVTTLNLQADESLIDTFANKKITFSLFESLPKDKVSLLGIAELTLRQHFVSPPYDCISFKKSIQITYQNLKHLGPSNPTGKNANAVATEDDLSAKLPEFEVEVSLSRPLFLQDALEAGNFITFKFDDMFPLPDEWSLKEGTDKDITSNIFTYSLHFNIPAESTNERLISIQNGLLQSSSEPPVLGEVTQITPIYQPKTTSADSTTKSQNPQIADQISQPPVVPSESQQFKKCIWGFNHVTWMPPEAVSRLREQISSKKPLEIEFTRELQAKFAHVQDPNAAKFKGKIVIDCSSLLFPRVIGIKGRFLVDTFDDTTDTYKSIGSSIGLQITLEKPLLDKKKLQPITKGVQDFIPLRITPPHLLFEQQSQKAENDFKIQVQEVVKNLVTEYNAMLKKQDDESNIKKESDISDDVESKSLEEEKMRRKKFMFHLNRSGSYFNLKERLKSAVVEIVRETFRKKSPFATTPEMQLFLSEIYVHLIDQTHIVLSQMFQTKNALESSINTTKVEKNEYLTLKQFAEAAEYDLEIEIANKYHDERLAKYDDSMQVWFDFACFCMRNGMIEKGEECFRIILSRHPRHVPTLIAYGAICANCENFEEARVYLVTSMELQPKYVLIKTILGLFYELIGEDLESENLLLEAAKLHKETLPPESPSIFVAAADFLVHSHAGQLAEKALSHEILTSGINIKSYLKLTQLELQRGNFELALGHVKTALAMQQDNPDVWVALGNLQFVQRDWLDAMVSYETVLSLPKDASNISHIYIRLGTLYLKVSRFREARTMYLRACEIDATSKSWLGVGKACLLLTEYEEAEDALSEANVLNNRDSEVWAYLSLLCLTQDRIFEANQAIKQALKLKIKDITVLRKLGEKFCIAGERSSATECFKMCLELHTATHESEIPFADLQKQFLEAMGDIQQIENEEDEG
ncbi:Cilia- and flagella-associated protein 70, partial [Nowakowskiella sp. JEL0078]